MKLSPKILAIGTAVPTHKISQQEHAKTLSEADGLTREDRLVLHTIYKRSGIAFRHSVLEEFVNADENDNQVFHPSGKVPPATVARRMEIYEEFAAPLAMKAAENCFAQLPSLQKSDISHVVAFSCTGMYAPGLDIQMVEMLDLPRNAERTCINFMGCYAAINALKSAYHICRSEPEAVVLLAGVELCSLHYMKSTDNNQVVANALFGDGAAVVIVSARDFQNVNGLGGFVLNSFYSEFEQSAGKEMVWRIGNHAFDLRLTPEVPAVVKENILPMLDKMYKRAGLSKEDVSHYAIHPGGTKILEACAEALDLHRDENAVSFSILRDFGNMSSVTILFVLQRYLQSLTPEEKSGQGKMLACAFGPGITMEAMILELF